MWVFRSPFKNYTTFLDDGGKRLPVVFSKGVFITKDEKVAKLLIEQRVGQGYVVLVQKPEKKKKVEKPKEEKKKTEKKAKE